jgi:hypothetical protein
VTWSRRTRRDPGRRGARRRDRLAQLVGQLEEAEPAGDLGDAAAGEDLDVGDGPVGRVAVAVQLVIGHLDAVDRHLRDLARVGDANEARAVHADAVDVRRRRVREHDRVGLRVDGYERR